MSDPDWLADIKFSDQGLIPAIAQDSKTNRVLMVAWMNRESLLETVNSGYSVYWSRSRQKLWRKGEESGNVQQIEEIRLDCDGDVLTLNVVQKGNVACHTGRESCFFRVLKDGQWHTVDPVIKSPEEMYNNE
ncbi:MAG: phosphoribosyl-AMP cyclohydrolase [Pseudomonadales bacterium]|nr:phosphoribosyl-AMP cyclohydrolase [Gammaproteobacteria bacterium]MDP6315807.1 phosphoribosyl-AMP cyclohydrolase [Pseudomonadales bacterium]MDP7315804.1 phosphoribosyl-AMP cyclohydrolase [Pseudomonadales bacterium]